MNRARQHCRRELADIVTHRLRDATCMATRIAPRTGIQAPT